MKLKALAIATVALMIPAFTPQESYADKWYESPWFWGPAGLVVGGVVGYELGRDRNRRPVYTHPGYGYGGHGGPYYYDGGPVLTGATYVDETRVWPFYRRTKVYPIASTSPVNYRPLSYAVPGPILTVADFPIAGEVGQQRAVEQTPTQPQEVNITIGDNNSGVNITVGGEKKEEAPRVVTRQIENARPDNPMYESMRGRVVEVQMIERSSQPAAEEKVTKPEEKDEEAQ